MKKIIFHLSLMLLVSLGCIAQGKGSNTLLWRIDGPEGYKPSYLFGTIHVAQKKFMVYSDSVYAAIQSTAKFYNEVDLLNNQPFLDPDLMKFLTSKVEYIDSLQKTKGWKKLIDRVNIKYNTKLAYDSLDQFVEFSQSFLASVLKPGMKIPDAMMAEHAVMMGKKTGGLETPLLQFKMLYEIVDARVSDTTLDFGDDVQIANLKNYYLGEQMDSIESIISSINPTYRKIVFDNRNQTMADSIEKHSPGEASFYAVGVGHLPGENGVIAHLREKGFKVSPVHSDNKISLLVVNQMIRRAKSEARKEFAELQEGKMELPPPPPPMEMKIDVIEASKKKKS
jgi:uncharacterized protein YbaP (TraB family)